jgi:hypothetical protein
LRSKNIFFLIFFLKFSFGFTQSVNTFLKPSDSLSKSCIKGVVISETALASLALVGLNQLWYSDYPRSNFHTIDDSSEWLQMDKAGHLFSTYHLGSFGANSLKWAGADRKSQLLYGSTIGFAFLSVVEVFDGTSSQWGFSWSDMAANATGTSLYVSQELLWKEQRIVPKFSFHTTQYAAVRPNVLGNSFSQQILKDYNGQTYWLSANVHSFLKQSKIPNWLNVAVGYGADGMITGRSEINDSFLYSEPQRVRQFYLSFDADLTKIHTKSHFLKTFFSVFNSIKIPAPTFEINGLGKVKFHYLYF